MRSARTGMSKPCSGAERVRHSLTPQTREAIRTGHIAGAHSLRVRKVVQIRCGLDRYPVLIGTGLLEQLGTCAHKYFASEACVVISDSNVAPLFADQVNKSVTSAGFRPTLITIPAGEKS